MSTFEVLASEDAQHQEQVVGARAVIAAQTRARQQFGAFVAKAATEIERNARIELIGTDLDGVVSDIASEYGFEDTDKLRNAATIALGGGHPSGCTCGFCKNKGKLPGSKTEDSDEEIADEAKAEGETFEHEKKEKEEGDDDDKSKKPWEKDGASFPTSDVSIRRTASVFDWDHVASVHTADGFAFCKCDCEGCNSGSHCESEKCIETKHSGNPGNPESAGSSEKTAADTETGDTFSQERVDLPSADESGLGGPSPKIDKSNSGDNLGWSTPEIEVPSTQHPNETQQVHDTPEYKKDLPGPSETGKQIDADSPLQPEFNVGDNTDTWTGTEGQADPVTSSVSKWSVIT